MKSKGQSDKYLKLIGAISAYWSVTELMCDQALAALLRADLDQARRINMAARDFQARLNALSALSEQCIGDCETRAEFRSLLGGLAGASRERDSVIHSVWFNLGYEDIVPASYRFERGAIPVAGSTKHTPEGLQEILDRMRGATERLVRFLLEHLNLPPATPGIVIHPLDNRPG